MRPAEPPQRDEGFVLAPQGGVGVRRGFHALRSINDMEEENAIPPPGPAWARTRSRASAKAPSFQPGRKCRIPKMQNSQPPGRAKCSLVRLRCPSLYNATARRLTLKY